MIRLGRLSVPLIGAALAMPVIASAQTLKDIVDNSIVGIGNQVLYIIYALAFVFFLFGMLRYFFSSGANAEKNRTDGKQFMLWGFIGLVVLFGVWAIVKILLGVLTSWA